MTHSNLAACFVLLLVFGTTAAQEPTEEKKDLMPEFTVHYWDRSRVYVVILEKDLQVVTKYGKQTIPFTDLHRITFGFHYPEGKQEEIAECIKLLGNNAYKAREGAAQSLRNFERFAYPLLKNVLATSADQEVIARATKLVERLKEKHPADVLSLKEQDVIQTTEFPMVGRLVGTKFKARSLVFGEIWLRFSEIKAIFGGAENGEQQFVIDAATHGSDPAQWLDAKVTVVADNPLRITITAEGRVDLWPQGPGQYLTNPKGYTTAGKGSTFMAGALVGRVGPKGKVFLIGDRYDGVPAEEGQLFLHIVPSPWNNASVGSYRVRISTAAR